MSNQTSLFQYLQAAPSSEDTKAIITTALSEDIGDGDVTSQWLVPVSAQAEMDFVAREELVACGTFIPAQVYAQLDPSVIIEAKTEEGALVAKGTVLAKATGSARSLLTGERVALNFMQRMSGVATLTRQYAEAVKGSKAVILDTRKTMPGMRALDKYAVRTGGAQNHRMRLDDMVMIKDNHIHMGRGQRMDINAMVNLVRSKMKTPIPVVVECDTLDQVKEALMAMPNRILLDNMSADDMRKAVTFVSGKIPLEASGGVSLETVKSIAGTGVNYISVGKLTHSAKAADIAADIKIL